MGTIHIARDRIQIELCFPAMRQLRPHLDQPQFVDRVQRQMSQGYTLGYVEQQGLAVSVSGFRYAESLAWGRYMYVDDLVTLESERSKGFGRVLFGWLIAQARAQGCEQLHLDSGVQRFAAHRFYLDQRMDITAHHFALDLHR